MLDVEPSEKISHGTKRGRSAKKDTEVETSEPPKVEKKTSKKEKVVKDEVKEEKPKKADKKEKTAAKPKEKPLKDDKKKPKEEVSQSKAKSGKRVKPTEDVEENGNDEPEEEKIPRNATATKWDKIDFSCTKKNKNGKTFNLKISCWNIGGLKSWVKKDCMAFLENENPDIVCLQETKCSEEKLPDEVKEIPKYKQYWCSSNKEGYAGVGLLTVKEPINVTFGIKVPDQDEDGRCITAEYKDYYVVCVYVPNAGKSYSKILPFGTKQCFPFFFRS